MTLDLGDDRQAPAVRTERRSLAGHLWHWLSADNRPPVRRLHVQLEHRTASTLWGATHQVRNFMLLTWFVILFAVSGTLCVFAIRVLSERPELVYVADAYVNDSIDAWEVAHHYPCATTMGADRQPIAGAPCTPNYPPPAEASPPPGTVP